MGNALRFKKFKYPGRSGPNAYYYNAFVRDVIVATIRHDSKGWWNSWHRTLIPATEDEKQQIVEFVAQLNAGAEIIL